MSVVSIYKQELGAYLGVPPSGVTLFWKGRVALYAILKALGIKEGEEVILPAFTCVVVPNAIIYLGARPIYVDIDPRTFNMSIEAVESKITSRTRVILAQNTFGLAPDLDAIMSIAKKHGLSVVEDCTHGFGGRYKGRLNGTIADASFFSTQWNKPFSTGIGGIAVVRDPALAEKVAAIEAGAVSPSLKDEVVLRTLMFVRENVVTPSTYWTVVKTDRFLSEKNLIIGSSQGDEMEKPVLPSGFIKGLSKAQAAKGIRELKKLDAHNKHRKGIAKIYNERLSKLGYQPVHEPSYAEHIYLKYPFLVNDRARFISEAEKSRIELGDWFNSPIHPIQHNFEYWQYPLGSFPVAEDAAKKMVNLPTHRGISESDAERIIEFISSHQHLIV